MNRAIVGVRDLQIVDLEVASAMPPSVQVVWVHDIPTKCANFDRSRSDLGHHPYLRVIVNARSCSYLETDTKYECVGTMNIRKAHAGKMLQHLHQVERCNAMR